MFMIMKRTAFLLKSFVTMALLGWTTMSHAQRYEIDRDRVYFGEEVVMQADARSFVDLGFGYAKDRRNVYLNGHLLEFVDPSSFRLKRGSAFRHYGHDETDAETQRGYYKTQFNVYYGNKKIDAQATTFVELGGGYAKDAFSVYYFGEKIKGSMAANFVILDGGYAKDAFNAYYRGKKVEGAFASTFKSTGDGYAEDTFNVYFKGKKLE